MATLGTAGKDYLVVLVTPAEHGACDWRAIMSLQSTTRESRVFV